MYRAAQQKDMMDRVHQNNIMHKLEQDDWDDRGGDDGGNGAEGEDSVIHSQIASLDEKDSSHDRLDWTCTVTIGANPWKHEHGHETEHANMETWKHGNPLT